MRLGFLYSHEFGERVIGNLINHSTFCRSCDLACEHCRVSYGSYASDIQWVCELPRELPSFIDDPQEYLPDAVPDVDVLVVIGLHPDLLAGLPSLVKESNVKAILVPLEDREWCPPGLRTQVAEELSEAGIEVVFPKPFCSLTLTGNRYIDLFVERYRIGRPLIKVEVEDEVIRSAHVVRSAPCGATWYIARQVSGKTIKGVWEIVSKAHHSYPCTASMQPDPEIGDTILHRGGYMAREAVRDAIIMAGYEPLELDAKAIGVKVEVEGLGSVNLEVFPWLEDSFGIIERALWVIAKKTVNPAHCKALVRRTGKVESLAGGLMKWLAKGDEILVRPSFYRK